jgi:hypothetical protein
VIATGDDGPHRAGTDPVAQSAPLHVYPAVTPRVESSPASRNKRPRISAVTDGRRLRLGYLHRWRTSSRCHRTTRPAARAPRQPHVAEACPGCPKARTAGSARRSPPTTTAPNAIYE